ncbi:hypothetical protein PRZ48_008804 [Zasmidium cellare]|uniref:Uncharacterized protein n=1 Tax=Zasmidium cellare TaxID=395010 RepID=A0ABR0EGK4_ZASCE|nr:hypothetical protein PRZ48_008804 [Zasmidium cellare]
MNGLTSNISYADITMSTTPCQEHTDRDARPESLGDAIMAAFDTPGFHWTDGQLIEGIHAIFTDARKKCYGLTEIREELVRSFGESQIVPRDGALLPLCKRFADELVNAMMASPDAATYHHILHIFENPVFSDELHGIVESKGLFPLPYAPRDESWFRAMTALTRKLHLVDQVVFRSIQFNTILSVVGRAAVSVLDEGYRLRTDKAMARYHATTPTDANLKFQIAEHAAQPERAGRLRNMKRLPPEIRMPIFSHLAKSIARQWTVNTNEDYVACCRDSILKMLCNVDFVPEFTVTSFGYVQRKAYRSTDLEEATAAFGAEVEEVLIKMLHIEFPLSRQTPGAPGKLALPRIIADWVPHIQHLHLHIKLITPYLTTAYYPSALYHAQDIIPNLKKHLPVVKRVEFTIVDHISGQPSLTIVPKLRQGETTKYAEIGRLVEGLIRPDAARHRKQVDYDDRVEASEDKAMVDTNSFVGAMVDTAGVAMEVKSIATGLGSIWVGIDERDLFSGW